MARPTKCRRVCASPEQFVFGAQGKCVEQLIMGVDEYEAIRLIDYEGMTQEQCASQMNVARPTITLIYENARKKLAEALIERKQLVIAGGNVEICEHAGGGCCGTCGRVSTCGNCKRKCRRRDS